MNDPQQVEIVVTPRIRHSCRSRAWRRRPGPHRHLAPDVRHVIPRQRCSAFHVKALAGQLLDQVDDLLLAYLDLLPDDG